MPALLPVTTALFPVEHGAQCSCNLRAQAMGLDPRKLSFDSGYRVLQKRWRMTRTHGEPANAVATTGLGERWRHVGRINPLLAILMSNDQVDE